ncbi:cutinase [Fimicolochytrium jonesii]|uniref:cutinase n=1 Tax=Fimicolochytrium jonesii TaxID=1396493 RepID=UPI0022FDEFFC|nr:cutinase [Fimicolochytrium jonesii]KAI8817022.1 cutinase [Fimicolochytrium jonesii]
MRVLALLSALAVGAAALPAGIPTGSAAPGCPTVEFLSVRGTTESQVGSTILNRGPVGRLNKQIAGSAIYNIVYPADYNFNTGPAIGARDLLAHLNSRTASCPSTRFVLAGYSQGAMVVQTALPQIPAATAPKVKAVIMFGDPYYDPLGPSAEGTAKGSGRGGRPVPAQWQPKLRDYCNKGDPVCAGGSNWVVHASYANDAVATQAVNFVTSLV